MTEIIRTSWGGTEITYNESDGKWVFELRGRERRVDSLRAAKEAIDKPEPKAKNPYKPVPCWLNVNGGWVPGIITSIAEGRPYSRTKSLWVVSNGTRSKLDLDEVFAATGENDTIRGTVSELRLQLANTRHRISALMDSMARADISSFEEIKE